MHFTIAPELLMAFKFDNGLTIQLSGRWYISDGDRGIGRPDPAGYFTGNREPYQVFTNEYGWINNEVGADGQPAMLADGFDTSVNNVSTRAQVEWGNFRLNAGFWRRDEGLGSEVPGYEYFANTPGIPFRALHQGYHLDLSYTADLAPWATSMTRLYLVGNDILSETQFVYTYQHQSVDNGVNPAVPDKAKTYNGQGSRTGVDQQFTMTLHDDPKWANRLVWGFNVETRKEQYFGISLGAEPSLDSTVLTSTWPSEEPSVSPIYFSWAGSLFFSDEQQLGDRLTLHAGLRVDLDTQVDAAINPRVALVGNPIGGFFFKLLYGSAFRAPTVFELYDEWRGNDELAAERIHTAELELRYVFENNAAFVALNAFYSRAEDQIEELPNPDTAKIPVGPAGQKATYYQNGSAANFGGLTVSGELRLFKDLRAYLNYTYLFTEDFRPIDGIAQHKLNLGVSYAILGKVEIDLRANWVGRTRAPSTNRYFQPYDDAWASNNYDYVVRPGADGYTDSFFVGNLTIRGKNLFGDWLKLEPVLMFRNVWDTQYGTLGRQSGSGTKPIDSSGIPNPAGFIPAYHPQPRFEFFFKLDYRL